MMEFQTSFRRWRPTQPLTALCALALAACATLPDYAAPRTMVSDIDSLELADVITYRWLTRDDFRGERPPAGFDARMAAVTCVYTEPVIDPEAVEIEFDRADADGEHYRVTLNNLSYRALMDRECSWWNPDNEDEAEPYTLEHEQVHFALFELAARRWSEAPPVRLEGRVDRRDALVEDLREQFQEHMRTQLDALTAENRRFDVQTSMKYSPEKQREWLDRVLDELAETSAPSLTAAAAGCRASSSARRAIEQARASLPAGRRARAAQALIDEAETAAGPPECDNVRARILADKARALGEDAAHSD